MTITQRACQILVNVISATVFCHLGPENVNADEQGARCEVWLAEPVELANLPRPSPPTGNVQTSGGFDIILDAGPTLQANPQALAAWEMAAAELEALISDPVTVTIAADLADLPPGVVGGTFSVLFLDDYETVRSAMIADGGADETLQLSQLPTFEQLNVALPDGFGVRDEIAVTAANCRAIGLNCEAIADASITFTTNLAFDFDPSNGISSGTLDFVGVAVHEMIHALGFSTVVDYIDNAVEQGQPPSDYPCFPLDLLRLAPGEGHVNYTAATRVLGPGQINGVQVCYDGAVDLRFSEGLYNGDGRQASHWRDDILPPNYDYGIMDPIIAFGQRREIQMTDLRALDLIGWDIESTSQEDCNENGSLDELDVTEGVSADCNDTGLPDECEIGDGDQDGDVDLDDYADFVGCTGGGVGFGCDVFDADCDGDVDLPDFGAFQTAFSP